MKPFTLRLLLISTLFLGIVLFVTCKKEPIETTGHIQGTIKNTENQPIEGVSVEINTSPEQSATTSSDGFYEFKDLSPDKYQISVSKTGFETDSKNVDVIVGDTKTLDFVMNVYTPTFTITSPASGTNWQPGVQQNITWWS